MKIIIQKNKYLKSFLAAWLLLILSSASSFSVTLPFSDDFTGNSIGPEWSWHDADGVSKIKAKNDTLYLIKSNKLVIKAFGSQMWGSADDYAAQYLDDINGDFTAIVQVNFQDYTSSWAKCGIMVRNDITDDDNSTGYVIMALTPTLSHGYTFQYDGDDNGRLGTKTDGSSDSPPNTWLKLQKTGQEFKGYYSSDGSNWTLLSTKTRTSALTIQDVGLFVSSNNNGDRCTVKFDNFSITGGAALHTYYHDKDGDGFGDALDSISITAPAPPVNYTTDFQDCDDNIVDGALSHPGATEICDGKDNNCDGNIDEGVGTNTYYYDADGDGFGVNTNTQAGCTLPAGFAINGGDCDDNNPTIFPGAYDVCGDGIDQDCTGSDRVCSSGQICLEIADIPLSTQIKSAPPLIMFLLDDSGSMAWDILCPEDNGKFYGAVWIYDRKSYWKSQFYGYNGIYYNPGTNYEPWPNYNNADPDTPRRHPYTEPNFTSTSTRDLSYEFTSIDGVSIKYAHWYMWSASENAPYLINLNGSTQYYKVTNYGSGDHGKIYDLQLDTSPPADVIITRSYALERQNFANWYKYYRTRELSAKAALSKVINDVKSVRVGIHAINHSIKQTVRSIGVDGEPDNKDHILTQLYNVRASGGTPLRRGLEDVGQYYHANDNNTGNLGNSPYANDADGGSCQQAFVIVMTDGYYNGYNPSVNNADGDDNTDFDGSPYGDSYSNTLADVAMYYYENDLSSLSNSVPQNDHDQATHQHMVTYTVSFGLTGTLTPVATCPDSGCPTWVDPGAGNDQKIDDLWHAAVNGRGKYLSASDTEDLVSALSDLMLDIQDRARTGAAVTMNTQKLESDTDLYQGYFDSIDWSGDLKAYDVDLSTGDVTQTASWSADTQLDSMDWNTGREIITFNGSSAIPFRYTNLTAIQKSLLSPNATIAQNLLNYIRGDISNEIEEGGILRDRSSKLGDIVNSSPTYENGLVYVGANDGMMHAFNAVNGKEVFAFIPSRVIENLRNYADENYSHNYFVDGTIATASIGANKWLIGGLGKGGRGYFGIDITNAASVTENNLPTIWEFPSGVDDDMGFSFSEVSIVNSNINEPVAIFGNGYDSPNGKAVLYIIKLDGTLVKKIDTGVGNSTTLCNGLSTPVVIDKNFDGKVDYAYAGDIQGNLWKFDLSSSDKTKWTIPYYDGSDFKPLFQAKNANGEPQSITGSPDVMAHCDSSLAGMMIVFGTGQYISHSDITNLETQTIYGIWDWAEEWEKAELNGYDKYLGYLDSPSGTPATRKLTNLDASSYFPEDKDLTLLQQTQTAFADGWRETTNIPIEWFSPKIYDEKKESGEEYTGGFHVGWYFDLPTPRERVIARTQIRDAKAIIVSIIPSESPCSAGGSSVVHIMSACNGGELGEPQFDTNEDGEVGPGDAPKTGKEFEDDIYYAPAVLEDKMYFSKDEVQDTQTEVRGLHYWKLFD